MARKNQGLKPQQACPCGSGESYAQCCGQFLSGKWPETAEQLMRSRYTAFTLNAEDYLLETWHHSTRPEGLDLSDQGRIKWTSLSVISHRDKADSAEVEFIARFKVNGKAEKIHEHSRFVRENSRWFYVAGDQK